MASAESSLDVPVRPLLIAGLVALPIAILSLGLFWLIEESIHLMWHTIPDAAGWHEPVWWYVLLVPVLGGVVTATMLRRIPAVHGASDGLSISPTPLRSIGWLLVAAIGTLAGGLTLGPEAPLLALGLTLGAAAAHLGRQPDRAWATAITLAGAFTALSTIFGTPFVTLLLVLEIVASADERLTARQLMPMLLPGFLAAGVGALTISGFGELAGIGVHSLALPDLPAYATVQAADVAWLVPVAVICAFVVRGQLRLAGMIRVHGARVGFWLMPIAGLVVGGIALFSRAVTDTSIDQVLFSGQSALPVIVTLGSVGTLVTIAACKTVAFCLSMGAGFEGGLFFPAIAISATIGVVASIVLPGAHLTPMLAVAVAAGTCAVGRLPLFGTVLAALLLGDATVDVIPLLVLGSVVAMIVTGLAGRHGSVAEPAAVAAPG